MIGAAQETFVDGWQRSRWAGATATALLLASLIVRDPRDRRRTEQDAAADESTAPSVVPVS